MKKLEYPNRQRMSQFVTTEMRMFNSVGGVRAVTWITTVTLWLEILFAFFYFLSRGRSRESLVHMSLLIAVLVLYLIATVVKNIYSNRNGEYYDVTMFYLSASFFISAFSSYLFLSTAWFWNFNGVIPGGSASVVKFVISHIFWLPAAAVAFYAVMLLFEPKNTSVRFGGLYWINCLLPALPLVVTLIVSIIKFPRRQAEAAEILAFLSITLLLYIAVRYAVKGLLYYLLNRETPRSNIEAKGEEPKAAEPYPDEVIAQRAPVSEEVARRAREIAERYGARETEPELIQKNAESVPTEKETQPKKPSAEEKKEFAEVKETKTEKPPKKAEKPKKEKAPKQSEKAKKSDKPEIEAGKTAKTEKSKPAASKKEKAKPEKPAKPPIKEIILNAAKNMPLPKVEKKSEKETDEPEKGKKVFRVKPLEEPREKKIYHRENKK